MSKIWKYIFIAVSVIGFFSIQILCRDAGDSGDEGPHRTQAYKVYDYYTTFGKDTAAITPSEPDYNNPYYGQLADNISAFISKTFHVEDDYAIRHHVNSLFGWLMFFFAALIAYRLAGWRAATFVFILMFFSPRLLGHSFNNLKDVPFASMMTMALYYMVRLIQEFPEIKIRTAIMLALAIGLSIAVRVGGLLLYPYFAMFAFLAFVIRNYKEPGLTSKTARKEFLRYLIYGVSISLVSYIVAVLLWPFAIQKPIENVTFVYKNMSSFSIAIRQLFEGTMQWSDFLPWYYTPKYIFMTIPIAVILGMILFFVFCWRKKEDRFWAFFVFFTFFFPVFWIVITRANVYGGWRHAMFAYPSMVIAAGWGFEGLVKMVEEKLAARKAAAPETEGKRSLVVNICSVVALFLLLVGPIRHIVANHPYEYVYFNELEGGVKKAFSQYEMDYYYHSTREATEWVLANAQPKSDGSKVRVGTWHVNSVRHYLNADSAHFQPIFIRWYEKENSDWDYAVFTVTGINPEYLRSPAFPPKNTVKTVEVDGIPIAIVLKREDKSDYYAHQLKEANNLDSAIILYQKALQTDPNNMGALFNIGECYLRVNKIDEAILNLEHYLKLDPKAENANYMYAYALIYQNKQNEALDVLHKVQKYNPKYMATYYLTIQLYLQKGDLAAAKKEFMKVIDLDRVDDQIVKLWVQYSAMQQINQQQAYINLYSTMAKSLDKRGKHKEAEQYRKLIGR